jgi:hypothetical protein
MLISLLIAVIVCGLLVYVVQLLPISQPFKQIAIAVVVVILIIWLLSFIGPHSFLR